MNHATWNVHRALIFARGLYHIAACDGLVEEERKALRIFLEQANLPVDLEFLSKEPFDFHEAAQALDSSWLRQTFLQACRLMVQLDGKISLPERDALRAMAAALGIQERSILKGIDGPIPRATELVNWVSERLVDFVSWDDATHPSWLWAFPHHKHALEEGGVIQVSSGQFLLLESQGELRDLLEPGEYSIQATQLPKLAEALDWKAGPIKARFIFVRSSCSHFLRWGTADPIFLHFPQQGPVQIRAFGRFRFRIQNPRLFVEKMAQRRILEDQELLQRIRRIISGRFAEALGEIKIGSDQEMIFLLNHLDELKRSCISPMRRRLEQIGLKLVRFEIESLTAPLELGLALRSAPALSLGERSADPCASEQQALLRPCARCLTPIPDDGRFCPRCGYPQRRSCQHCAQELPLRARFCSACGEAQNR